jgi:hypothetical protein
MQPYQKHPESTQDTQRTSIRHEFGDRIGTMTARTGIIILVTLSLYALNISYNLHCFYERGVGDDSGWFAWLASNARDWPIPNPDVIGGNFLSIHMSPIFFVSTALLLPLSDLPVAVRFCIFISLWAPLLWLALFLLLDRFTTVTFHERCTIAFFLTFNGLMLSMLGFPHIEMLIPAFGLLAIAICLRAETAAGWAGAGFIALLAFAIREDVGLHLFLVVVAVTSVSWARDWRATQRLVGLAALSIACSVLALLVQGSVPGGGKLLGNVYLGHPAFSGVSVASLARRLFYWGTRRQYIFLPLLVLLISGYRQKGGNDRRMLLGAALALPWLALSLVATTQQAGDLWSYYCFPLVFVVFWPLLLGQTESPPPRSLLRVQLATSGLSTAAFVAVGLLPHVGDGGLHDKAPWLHLLPPSPTSIHLTEASLANRDGWLFDYGAAALVFGSLRPGQFRPGLEFNDTEIEAAHGFVRFNAEPQFLAPQIAALKRAFPICAPIERTVLQVCTRSRAEGTADPHSRPG